MDLERRLALGPRELVRVTSLVVRARVWAELLREVPEDVEARAEARRMAAALVHYADQRDWPELGRLAGMMVRTLANPDDPAAPGRVRLAALRLERVVHRRALGLGGGAR
jgi:hypothetical protein